MEFMFISLEIWLTAAPQLVLITILTEKVMEVHFRDKDTSVI
jgi:hypothetical protein